MCGRVLFVQLCGCSGWLKLLGPLLWAVMKLNSSVWVSYLLEVSQSTSCPVSHSSVFSLFAVQRVFSLSCPHYFHVTLLVLTTHIFYVFEYFHRFFCKYFSLFSLFFSSPNVNSSCCGFLQKLSVCLLSVSDPPTGSHNGIQRLHAQFTTQRKVQEII